MKTIMRKLMLTTVVIGCSILPTFGQDLAIEGNVIIAGSGGVGKPNWPVTIQSLPGTLTFNQTVYTNIQGHYLVIIPGGAITGPNQCWQVSTHDTCISPGSIVSLYDTLCNQQGTISYAMVNFEIGQNCSPPATCSVHFSHSMNQLNQVVFQSHVLHSNQASPIAFHWNFGDGTTASDPNPVHQFSSGSYRVCLTVAFTGGCTATFCDSVHVSYSPGNCEAAFTFSPVSSTTPPFEVQFHNTAVAGSGQQIISYYWNFGDGQTATTVHPIHSYQAAGTYRVCLIITTSDGCTDDYCQQVTVGPSNTCNASFTFQVNNLTASFTNTSTFTSGTATYQWNFGDGHSSHQINPVHTYSAPGTYQVCLVIVTSNNCAHTYCQTVIVNSPSIPCDAAFTYIIQGDTVLFFNNSVPAPQPGVNQITYLWTFGDGSSSTIKNPKKAYPILPYPQTFQVCLRIMVYTANGTLACSDSSCQAIVIYPFNTQCDADFRAHIGSGGVVEFANLSSFAPGSTAEWFWTFGNGTSSTQKHPRIVYSHPGTYTVCLKMRVFMSNNTTVVCEDSVCKTIVVSGFTAPCEADFTAHPVANLRVEFTNQSYTANPQATVYQWTYGDGTDATGFAPDHIYTAPGVYTVCLYLYDQIANCRDTICKTVVVGQPNVACAANFIFLSTASVPPFTAAFQDISLVSTGSDSIISWHWNFGDGTTSSLQHPTHTYTMPGNYTVCLTIATATGCTSTLCKPLNIGNNTLCAADFTFTVSGYTVTFTNTSNQGGTTATYLWTFGDNTSSHQQNPVHTYTAAGQYRVCLRITTANGCTSDICKWITVGVPVTPTICRAAFTFLVGSNYRVEFTNQSVSPHPNATIYRWSFGDGITSAQHSPQHFYQAPGTYNVCLYMYDQQSNCRDTICKQVIVGISTVPPCEAAFSYTVNGNQVQFTSTSTPMHNTTSHYWSFGDGTTSTVTSPLHIFPAPGTYTVCLTIVNTLNGCTDDVCHTIVIGPTVQQQFCISGRICKGIGSNPAFPAIVYLIYYDSTQGSLTAVRTTTTSPNGEYGFCNIPHGRYLVKAALTPNAPDYHHYLPTYYGNSLFWNYAIQIILNQNRQGVDICLIAGNNPGGPGFVGGYVQYGANKTGSLVGEAVVGVQVMLLDSDDNPVQYIFSDDEGRFIFHNVAYGTYKVYAEILNKTTIPYYVTIGPEQTEKDNIILLVESTQVISGTEKLSDEVINMLRVYPNPAGTAVYVAIELAYPTTVHLSCSDITGKVLAEEVLEKTSGITHIYRIDMSTQEAGVYFVRLVAPNTSRTIKVIKY